MTLLVDLRSKIDAFHFNAQHLTYLKCAYPQHDIVVAESREAFDEALPSAEVVLLWKFTADDYARADKLQAIHTPAAGKDWVAEDPQGRVPVFHSSFHGQIIRESFMAMLLYFNNRLDLVLAAKKEKDWARNAFKDRQLLTNQKLLIIGCGAIGRYCAETAMAFGMEVVGMRRQLPDQALFPYIKADELLTSLPQADHVLNLLPGGKDSERFVKAEHFSAMKASACFYNFGRGSTVDEEALIEALENGDIKAAGLDVMAEEPLPEDSPLWSMKNVLLTPHSSCCYQDYLYRFIDGLKEMDSPLNR